MRSHYINCLKEAIKSKEYWFGVTLIIISSVLTSVYNLSPTGVFGNNRIGSSEFFIASIMYSNIILKITAPMIPIFVCMNRSSFFMKDNKSIQKAWNNNQIKPNILACATLGSSVFAVSFLIVFLIGIVFFPAPTGSISINYGLFKQVYEIAPVGYILLYILYSSICGALYALFGFSLKAIMVKSVNLVLIIPLVYYSCFIRIAWLFPLFDGLVSIIAPLLTFDFTAFDTSLLKRIAELGFVLVISVVLLMISYFKNKKRDLLEDKDASLS